jgi:hypothetical protein
MSWIKWNHGLAKKPEVMQIAFRLGKSRHEVAGILMELWEWADENVTTDETASGFDPDNCPGTVRLGEQSGQLLDATIGVAGLADALSAVGWIQVRSGSLVFPKFGRHNGKSAKARALDSARKRAERANTVRNVSGSEPDKVRTRREEKRREEETPPNPPPGGGAKPKKPADEHPHFAAFWTAYPRKTAKPAAAKAFAKIAPDDATFAAMLAALDRQRRSPGWVKDGGQFIPHPATWLNGRRWEDQPPEVSKPKPQSSLPYDIIPGVSCE